MVGCAYKYQNLNSSMHFNLLFLASMQIWKSFFFYISRTSSRPRLQRKSSMFWGKKNFVFVELQNRLYTKLQWNTFFLFFLGHHLLVLSFSFSSRLTFIKRLNTLLAGLFMITTPLHFRKCLCRPYWIE